jgi:hypothetical protein
MSNEIGEYLPIAFGSHFLPLEHFEILLEEIAVVSPLPAGMTPQIADVDDSDTDLPDLTGLATILVTRE